MKAKLGSGARFAAIESKAEKFYKKKGKSAKQAKAIAGAVAAKIGAKKYGQKKMTAMAVKSKKSK
jgi:hypothetical protein